MAIAGVIGIPVGILFTLPSWPVLNAGFLDAYAVLEQGLFGAGLGAALGTGLWLLDRKGP